MELPAHLSQKLETRKAQNAYRALSLHPEGLIDFCSNDYLGIVKNSLLNDSLYKKEMHFSTGSTGSRLLTGNSRLAEATEQLIADFHEAEAALLFNSGYDANVGVLSCVAQKGDTIIYDALCHASIRDGIRLSLAAGYSFRHNNVEDLRKKMKAASGTIYIVTESVFSMDGDTCPLSEILTLCSEFGAYLILDEAHSIGVIGNEGEGLSQHLQLHAQVWCRIYTFGKACGCHGAVVVGAKSLHNYLINFARSFIYSTALPGHALFFIQHSYTLFPQLREERTQLQSLIYQFQTASLSHTKLPSKTPIQAVIIQGNNEVKALSQKLRESGLDVRSVLYPTVPKGSERLRIILHSFNKKNELEQLIHVLQNRYKKIKIWGKANL